jgi:hypothetical protein
MNLPRPSPQLTVLVNNIDQGGEQEEVDAEYNIYKGHGVRTGFNEIDCTIAL